jgi:hypothetical protein
MTPDRLRRGASSRPLRILAVSGCLLLAGFVFGPPPTTVPPEIQQPGTQPTEMSLLSSVNCDNCHTNYDTSVSPGHNWKGGMMSHSSRDPVFWAALAVAEQDFQGSGDLCLRCHVPLGWLEGRSEPTDGSALLEDDADGVTCHLCHALTNPDQSEHLGVQNAPFVANDGGMPPEGNYGSGQYVLWNGPERLGPYNDATSPHQSLQSQYHRKAELCGTCHDVSNPFTGDMAHNNGASIPLAPGTFSGVLGAPVTQKAAFNNFPFAYGVVERTYSEHFAGGFDDLRVSDYATLPAELRDGSIEDAYLAAQAAGYGGDYADGATRYFSCQSCHMRPVVAAGCGFGSPPTRTDMPHHDQTGGNYWVPDAIQYLDALGRLRLGGGLPAGTITAMNDGKARALHNLTRSAKLELDGDDLRVINLTGHKLITGYPEGRRMWLNVKWYDSSGGIVREDGAYGPITATVNGLPTQVDTLLNPSDPYLRLYHAKHGMTQEWANQLLGLGLPSGLPLMFDRQSGSVALTLGALAAMPPGSAEETFHFVLNNTVLEDTRIPPYGYDYDEARTRNALPIPETQYGNPGAGGTYEYWDEVQLAPPVGAVYAEIDLLYQPTSWEYIQFLDLANDGSVTFLQNEGSYLLDAWLNTGMAAPEVMASIAWNGPGLFTSYCEGDGSGPACPCGNVGAPGHGCDNAQATGGALLQASGLPAFNNVVLHGSGFPTGGAPSVLVIRSPGQTANPFGDGLLCVAPPVVRFGATFAAGGLTTHPVNHGAGPGTFHYQLWYRNNPGSFCTPSAFNLSNGLSISWP